MQKKVLFWPCVLNLRTEYRHRILPAFFILNVGQCNCIKTKNVLWIKNGTTNYKIYWESFSTVNFNTKFVNAMSVWALSSIDPTVDSRKYHCHVTRWSMDHCSSWNFTFRMPIKVYIGFYSKFGLVNITISNYHAFRNVFNSILLHKWFTLTLEEIHWSTIIIIKQSVNVRHFKGEKMSKVLWSHINHCVIKYLGNHQNWFWVSYIGVVLIFSYTK